MPAPPLPADESGRLRLLEELCILDTAPEPGFDAIARLAAETTGCSRGALCFVDARRVWCKATYGFDGRNAPREVSCCAYAIAENAPLCHDDITADARFAAQARAAGVRAYAAAPVRVEGHAVAAVAVFDPQPREFGDGTATALADLACLAAELLRARLSEQRWQYALEVSGQGVWDWDVARRHMWLSPGWRALFGLGRDDDAGTDPLQWARRIHPDDLGAAQQRLQAHLRGDTEAYSGEYRMRHLDGRWLWVHNRGKVVQRDARGRALRAVGTLLDVTERRAVESAQRNQQAAELASEARSRFLSRMSHEIRTPLNAMLGFTQLLADTPVEPTRVREYAGHSLAAGRQLLDLVDKVLDLQHVDGPPVPVTLEAVPLQPLVARVVAALRGDSEARGVHLEPQVPDGVAVRADARLLHDALLALSSNALRYNRPAGRVRWLVEASRGRVTLVVEDTGAGMSDAQMARLFEPFERLGRETGPIEGAGLGLLIARAAVEKMGGRLAIESRPGQGTRVAVELPDATPAAAPAAPSAPADTAPPMRLLYVEDNRVNALLFSEAVKVLGNVELRIAEDGQEALDTVADWHPDVLVLDAHLPSMTGYEVLERLRMLPGLEHTPAVMCSADALPDDIARARAAGFVGYWTKPIDVARVMAELRQFAAASAATTP